MKLQELIRQERFANVGQKAMLNLLVTSSWVNSRLNAIMSPHGVTPAQYNVLRILRGRHPESMTCSDIGVRLLDRTPDVTRLLNRLEKSGLVERNRSDSDRRVVMVGITEQGIDLLSAMEPEVESVHRDLSSHLSEGELAQLSDMLERYRTDQVA